MYISGFTSLSRFQLEKKQNILFEKTLYYYSALQIFIPAFGPVTYLLTATILWRRRRYAAHNY